MKGILIVNTGSPASPYPKDVRAFVEAMLMDPLVMTVPNWFRPILVKGIIGPFRQFASAKKYSQIWGDEEESPLIISARKLASELEKQTDMIVEIGMTYLEPSISYGFQQLQKREVDLEEVIVLPLFPQFAESSYLTAVQKVQKEYDEGGYSFQLRIIEPYFNHPAYIGALAKSMAPYLKENYERIIFNFHSLPLDHVEKGFKQGLEFDYVYQLKETVRLLVHELNIPTKPVRISYSSAFGKKWLEPSLNDLAIEAVQSGVERLLVISPGFAADNLETLYDIGVEANKTFLDHGGKELVYIPSLNSEKYWIDAVQQIIS